jgi:hypothetical protein
MKTISVIFVSLVASLVVGCAATPDEGSGSSASRITESSNCSSNYSGNPTKGFHCYDNNGNQGKACSAATCETECRVCTGSTDGNGAPDPAQSPATPAPGGAKDEANED